MYTDARRARIIPTAAAIIKIELRATGRGAVFVVQGLFTSASLLELDLPGKCRSRLEQSSSELRLSRSSEDISSTAG
jgi:hypothetical protein